MEPRPRRQSRLYPTAGGAGDRPRLRHPRGEGQGRLLAGLSPSWQEPATPPTAWPLGAGRCDPGGRGARRRDSDPARSSQAAGGAARDVRRNATGRSCGRRSFGSSTSHRATRGCRQIASAAAERAAVVGSGRVGRTRLLSLEERAGLAARACIRHHCTGYHDDLDRLPDDEWERARRVPRDQGRSAGRGRRLPRTASASRRRSLIKAARQRDAWSRACLVATTLQANSAAPAVRKRARMVLLQACDLRERVQATTGQHGRYGHARSSKR